MSAHRDAMATLADALRLERYQLVIAAGSLRRADELARGVASGDVTIDEARADLGIDPGRSRSGAGKRVPPE